MQPPKANAAPVLLLEFHCRQENMLPFFLSPPNSAVSADAQRNPTGLAARLKHPFLISARLGIALEGHQGFANEVRVCVCAGGGGDGGKRCSTAPH